MTIIVGVFCAFILILSGATIYFGWQELKQEKEMERQRIENEKRTREILKAQSEKKASIRNGKNADNFNSSIELLHDYAKDN